MGASPSSTTARKDCGSEAFVVERRGPALSSSDLGSAPLLRVKDLCTSFFTSDGEVRAVDGVSFDIEDGQTVGLVGESGCGKSVTALSIIQLLDKGTGRVVGGEIIFRGKNSASLGEQ